MFTRLRSRRLGVAAAAAVCIALGVLALFRHPVAAFEVDAKEQEKAEAKAPEPFDIPEGDPKELFAFVKDLLNEEKEFGSEDEQREHILRVMATQVAVGDKVLKLDKLEDEQAERAAQLKVQGLVNLAVLGVPGGAQQAVKAVNKMADDERSAVAEFAKNNQRLVRIICIGGLPAEERDELITEILDELQKRKFAQRVLRQAQMLGEALQESGDQDRLIDFYEKLAKLMSESGIEALEGQANRIEGQLRRLKLPGNLLEIDGTTLAGEEFDWKAYRGKVVLVDFWATWCGPCRAELPNVKKNYKKYHEKGFDVVGISLDEDQSDLEEFIKDEKIPWVTLFPTEESNRGWDNPLAVKYGINGIPMAILVDKEGKVVSMSARGKELSQLLEEMLGEKE